MLAHEKPAVTRPRVLVLTPDFPPAYGGIQRLMHQLVTHRSRLEMRVVTLAASGGHERDRADGLVVSRIATPPAVGHAGAIAILNAACVWHGVRLRPDVVLSGHIALSPAALALRRALGIPYVQYLHGREVITRPRLSRRGIARAERIVAVSSHTAGLALEHGAERARVHVVPPGVDAVPPSNGRPASQPTVVSVARLEQEYKGQDVLIRALPLVLALVPSAQLVVVGDGRLRPAYARLADALGVAENVRFVGSVDDTTRNKILSRAHVFAMPSRLPKDGGGEGFGIVYLEAAAHGLPVVAGNVAGAVDAVVDGQTGTLVDPSDHVAVAGALSDLLLDRAKAESFGRAGAERARKSFSWESVARRVEDVLLEVAAPQ